LVLDLADVAFALRAYISARSGCAEAPARRPGTKHGPKEQPHMPLFAVAGYGIIGILVIILLVVLIVYFLRRA
jgi:hypothetical protein